MELRQKFTNNSNNNKDSKEGRVNKLQIPFPLIIFLKDRPSQFPSRFLSFSRGRKRNIRFSRLSSPRFASSLPPSPFERIDRRHTTNSNTIRSRDTRLICRMDRVCVTCNHVTIRRIRECVHSLAMRLAAQRWHADSSVLARARRTRHDTCNKWKKKKKN